MLDTSTATRRRKRRGFTFYLKQARRYALSAGYQFEHLFILEFEALRRLALLADPRVHSRARRLRAITEGRAVKPGQAYFVLVLFPGAAIPPFTQSLIDALAPSRFNLVAVSNAPLSDTLRGHLLRDCHLLIERDNVGRDFGAYKDAIDVIEEKSDGGLRRLVLANDSVYYFKQGLDKLIADLDGPQDFIGVSEVFDHHYHVATFLASFGERVLASAAFKNFWARFKPLGTRRWNIFKGEGALARTLLDAGFKPHVLYRAETLRNHLRALTKDELIALMVLLPTEPRGEIAEMLEEWDLSAEQLADAFFAAIMERNQMHAAGFLFRKFMGLPVIKRDIVFREIYPGAEMQRLFADLDPSLREEVLADVGRRGSASQLGPLGRLLYRHSVI